MDRSLMKSVSQSTVRPAHANRTLVLFDTLLRPAASTSSCSIATVPTSLRPFAATFEILFTHEVVVGPSRSRLLSGWREGRSQVAFRRRCYGNRERAR